MLISTQKKRWNFIKSELSSKIQSIFSAPFHKWLISFKNGWYASKLDDHWDRKQICSIHSITWLILTKILGGMHPRWMIIQDNKQVCSTDSLAWWRSTRNGWHSSKMGDHPDTQQICSHPFHNIHGKKGKVHHIHKK